jgi:chromosomal replication initiation ATPase DnaA
MLIPGIEKTPSDNNIIQVVEDYFIQAVKTKRRFRSLVVARQVCMYLMRKHTNKTYKDIACEFDMNHATVFFTYKQINNLLSWDKKLQSQIKEIETILKLNN